MGSYYYSIANIGALALILNFSLFIPIDYQLSIIITVR